MTRNQIAGGLAGLLLSTTVIAGSVLASSAPSAASVTPAATTASAACATEWTTAHTSPSVAALKVVGDCEVDRRLATIATMRTEIGNAAAMTADHKAALTATLDADQSGLGTLRTTIDGDTTVLALRTDIHRIFTDYRVYAVVARQVRLVRGDDAVAAATARLDAGAAKLQAAITKAKGNGKDTTVAETQLAAMQAAIADARAQIDGDAAGVLSQTPAGFNAGTAGPVLDAARTSIKSARADAATALAAGKAAIASLK